MRPSELARLAADLLATGNVVDPTTAIVDTEYWLFKGDRPHSPPPAEFWFNVAVPLLDVEYKFRRHITIEDRIQSLLRAAEILESNGQ